MKCTICGKPITKDAADFPFCSDRCRMVDLGKWMNGDYVISTPAPAGSGQTPDSQFSDDDED